MSRPVLEEVEDDIDNMDMDLAQFDPNLRTPIAPIAQPTVTRSQDSEPNAMNFESMMKSMAPPPPGTGTAPLPQSQLSEAQKEEIAHRQVLYPCYFDINRSHAQGRRVKVDLAVENPVVEILADACVSLHIPVVIELNKCHPQDFGNPGRVRVDLKLDGETKHPQFPNKRALLNKVAEYLNSHPTTLDSIAPKKGRPYSEDFDLNFTPEEIPKVKGFKMNTIVPLSSPLTIKHPMTKSIYDPEPEAPEAPKLPKQQKKKIKRVRA